MVEIMDFKQRREARERERRKLEPGRLRHIEQYKQNNPNWTPEDLEQVHRELDAWGSRLRACPQTAST
jgi:hypothetical protein